MKRANRAYWLILISALIILLVVLYLHRDFPLTGRVWRVIDGDTLVIDGRKVRLLCIDAPEIGTREGLIARERLLELLSNRKVALSYQSKRIDAYGRLLAFVEATDSISHQTYDVGEMMYVGGYSEMLPGFSCSRRQEYEKAKREYYAKPFTAEGR